MRLFQAATVYPSYLARIDEMARKATTFRERRSIFLGDRHGAAHFLKPILDGEPEAVLAIANDLASQRMWARENGLGRRASLEDILLCQVEEHRTEVFYCMDPVTFPSAFVRRLPSCVERTVAWRAAPTNGAEFSAYDLVVCNFPSLLEEYCRAGCRVAWFAPAHDPAMDILAKNEVRPIDVIFIGGYTRHHRRRAALLEAVASLSAKVSVAFHLDRSRLTRLADAPLLGSLPFLCDHRTPAAVQQVSGGPIFGMELYKAIARSKIVLNGAIDVAGRDRGNIRCFEAMGCGSVLLSDEGRYPPEMNPGHNLVTYETPSDAVSKIQLLLANAETARDVAERGYQCVSRFYSKERQFQEFIRLID